MDGALLNKLLQVEPPCTVKRFLLDEAGRRLDVWIGIETPRTWFGAGRKAPADTERLWRHVNLGHYHCYVHAVLPEDTPLAEFPWAGDERLSFTRAKAKQIFGLLGEGMGYESICTLLDVPFDELWRYKYALDRGATGLGLQSKPAKRVARPAAPAGGDQAVPDATDPVWQELAEGRVQLDIRVLSLQLLLTRMRSQMNGIQDAELKLLKLRELHRYMVKNERLLGHELSQLRRV